MKFSFLQYNKNIFWIFSLPFNQFFMTNTFKIIARLYLNSVSVSFWIVLNFAVLFFTYFANLNIANENAQLSAS